VYVNARAWGELTAEADALAVGNAVKWILWTCGHKGGELYRSAKSCHSINILML
jgi:hypothetical protein